MAPPKKPSENVLDARKKIAREEHGAGVKMHSLYVFVPVTMADMSAKELRQEAAENQVLARSIERQQAIVEVRKLLIVYPWRCWSLLASLASLSRIALHASYFATQENSAQGVSEKEAGDSVREGRDSERDGGDSGRDRENSGQRGEVHGGQNHPENIKLLALMDKARSSFQVSHVHHTTTHLSMLPHTPLYMLFAHALTHLSMLFAHALIHRSMLFAHALTHLYTCCPMPTEAP